MRKLWLIWSLCFLLTVNTFQDMKIYKYISKIWVHIVSLHCCTFQNFPWCMHVGFSQSQLLQASLAAPLQGRLTCWLQCNLRCFNLVRWHLSTCQDHTYSWVCRHTTQVSIGCFQSVPDHDITLNKNMYLTKQSGSSTGFGSSAWTWFQRW